MDIHPGEIYGKQTASRFVMYHVLKVNKGLVTLQNIDNPLSLFEISDFKLQNSGYTLVSQTPYVNTQISSVKKKKAASKPARCPYTLDIFEQRADSQRPTPKTVDLFSAQAL